MQLAYTNSVNQGQGPLIYTVRVLLGSRAQVRWVATKRSKRFFLEKEAKTFTNGAAHG
jgi:hypothetical protein